MTTWEAMEKVVSLSGPAAIAIWAYFTTRKAASEKAERDRLTEEARANTEARTTETRMLPEMMDRYIRRIEALEKEIRDQTGRMEREAIRMRNYISRLHSDYHRALSEIDHPTRKASRLPEHDSIPEFGDPVPR